MKECRIHRVYLATPAGLALRPLVARPVKVSARAVSGPTSAGPVAYQPIETTPRALQAGLDWLPLWNWSDALAWLVGGDLVALTDFLLADWPAAKWYSPFRNAHSFAMLTTFLSGLSIVRSYACGALLASSTFQPAQAPGPAQPAPAAPATHPLRAPKRGSLVDIFFSAGDHVKRGQILAKLEGADGHPTYLIAPVAGKIGPALRQLGETLAMHTTLAVITLPAPVR